MQGTFAAQHIDIGSGFLKAFSIAAAITALSACFSPDGPTQDVIIEGDTTSTPETSYYCVVKAWDRQFTSFDRDPKTLTIKLSAAYPFVGEVTFERTETGTHYKFTSNGRGSFDFNDDWAKAVDDCTL